MYVCELHGALDGCWCNDCGENVYCDCLKMVVSRKEIAIDCSDGIRDVIIEVEHCDTCGEVRNVRCPILIKR